MRHCRAMSSWMEGMVKLKVGAGSMMGLHGSTWGNCVYRCSRFADTMYAAPEQLAEGSMEVHILVIIEACKGPRDVTACGFEGGTDPTRCA